MDDREFGTLAKRAKSRLLSMHYQSGAGHIGGCLSSLDIMLCLHHEVMGDGDTFILSKGHAAGALYITLWTMGKLTDEELRQFHGDGTKLAGHPAPNWHPNIPAATGSLGHGLPIATGLALGRRFRGEDGRVFCLMSDGELEEGSNWEALLFIAHHKIGVAILVDANGLQGFGSTTEVASLEPLGEKIAPFGIKVVEADGHDHRAILKALEGFNGSEPLMVILRTVKGKGVSFMEGKMDWHYLSMTPDQYQKAMAEIDIA